MVKRVLFCVALAVGAIYSASGCGYTTKTSLPEDIKTIYVAPVKNAIDLSSEITDERAYRAYRPGLEVELTNAIINRFIFDGTIKIASPARADAVVESKLVSYRRDPLRYSDGDDVEEYRLNVVLDVAVINRASRKIVWHDTGLSGDATYFLSGSRSISEDEALTEAVEDTARRVVERTMEVW